MTSIRLGLHLIAPAPVFAFTLPFVCAVSGVHSAWAQQTVQAGDDAHPVVRDTGEVKRVEINGGRLTDTEERRRSTAAKIVVGREELDRQGDSTLGEILKRLPGVTVAGTPGRGGDIRMRGLGNGYTQILVNGERPPRGFSLDSLSPDQIERIEIFRAPVAEHSTQAVAGTINIVLREDLKMRDTQVRITQAWEQGRASPNMSVTLPGELGRLSYLLTASIFQSHQADQSVTVNHGIDAPGDAVLDQTISDQSNRLTRGIHLSPRLSYKFEHGDTLVIQPFLMHAESNSNSSSVLDQTLGPPAQYAYANASGDSSNTVGRLFSTWTHRFDDKGKLEFKLSAGGGYSRNGTTRFQYDGVGTQTDLIQSAASVHDTSWATQGKYTRPFGEGHVAAFGWDIENGRRNERSSQTDNGLAQFADSGDILSAQAHRLAFYAQDEWEINARWSSYYGLRYEAVRTSSALPAGEVDNRSSVWSPVWHAVYHIPEHDKDQVRMSITHSYRAPQLNDLIAVPALSRINSTTSPDRYGNPYLKPELATGLDLAFEHYLAQGGILSASIFSRSIDNLMRREISLQNTILGPRWVSQPENIGHATTRGIELEAKFQLKDWYANAPALDVRTNYSHFWSSVDTVQGPNNRLDQQPRQTANLGLDYKPKGLPLTLGGNLNWTPAYVVQTSDTQLVSAGNKRQLDIYALWKFSPTTQLRFSANNLINSNYLTGNAVDLGGVDQSAATTTNTYTTYSLRLELKI